MRKSIVIITLILVIINLTSCSFVYNYNENIVYKKGDKITFSGRVEYIEDPSDIGDKYCSLTGEKKVEYYYTDIYDEQSKWSSNEFFTKDNDTIILKKYVGQNVTVTGIFDTESHGIPYITNIEVSE